MNKKSAQRQKISLLGITMIFIIASVIVLPYHFIDDVFAADSDSVTSSPSSPVLTLDRTVYPVPFGEINDFKGTMEFHPDGRSLFPVHYTAIVSAGKIQAAETLGTGDLVLHIRINDANFDVSPRSIDKISQDVANSTVGPLKISVSRNSQTLTLAYAGGNTPNERGVIDVGDDSSDTTRQLGPIVEVAPEAGIFELDFVVRYSDGPANSKCPATAVFTSLNDRLPAGSEESRFDTVSSEKEDYCIMKGDILTVEYTHLDDSGNIVVSKDVATFDLRDGVLESDKRIYPSGHDLVLTLIEPDLDLDNDLRETYDLDLIEWDSNAATVTLGDLGGELMAFDPLLPLAFKETGDSTGIFQAVVKIPQTLQDNKLERGEEIILEYTDWGPSGADHVGQEDEDVNLIIYTYAPPLQQTTRQGIVFVNEITCPDNMVLAIKYDGTPACVKPSTLSKLMARGWTQTSLVDDAVVETNTVPNIQPIQWLETSYPASGTGVVRVFNPDMNLDPESFDNFDVDVWSDSDLAGIDLTVTETNHSTGIFEGTLFFSTNDDSSGHRLRVSGGDTITAKYGDHMLPDPSTTTTTAAVADEPELLVSTATIRETNMPVDDEDSENQITLDKKAYTWTDKVYITIVAPEYNLDSSMVEDIGSPDNHPVKIYTRNQSLSNYKLVETGLDTGIFTGEITLTGNPHHDADGDGNEGDASGLFNGDNNKENLGPKDGLMPVYSKEGGLTVSFEFAEDKVAVASVPITWNAGKVQWLESSYRVGEIGNIMVTDPDLNFNPEEKDEIIIDVWSDSDAGGVDIVLKETEIASGAFRGMVVFTDEESSGHQLRVAEGDVIRAEYEDNTLPEPYMTFDEIDIVSKVTIKQ